MIVTFFFYISVIPYTLYRHENWLISCFSLLLRGIRFACYNCIQDPHTSWNLLSCCNTLAYFSRGQVCMLCHLTFKDLRQRPMSKNVSWIDRSVEQGRCSLLDCNFNTNKTRIELPSPIP